MFRIVSCSKTSIELILYLYCITVLSLSQAQVVSGEAVDYFGNPVEYSSQDGLGAFEDKALQNYMVSTLDTVLNKIDPNPEIPIKLGKTSNLLIVADNRGEPVILYDKDFVEEVLQEDDGEWMLLSILAHEVGHYTGNHLVKMYYERSEGRELPVIERRKIELEADEFSGQIMYRLGAERSQAEAAVAKFIEEGANTIYPDKEARLFRIGAGWYTARTTQPEPEPVEEVDATLPRIGKFSIESKPSGVTVFIDGIPYGVTPIEGSSLQTGEHILRLFSPDYVAIEENFTVEANSTTVLNYTLTSLAQDESALLKISTIPENATVLLNGGETTKQNLQLDAGSYTLIVSAEGYVTNKQNISLTEGEQKTLTITLSEEPKLQGSFVLTVNQSIFEVSIGETIYENQNTFLLEEGIYPVTVRAEGMREASFTITIVSGEEVSKEITLNPIMATVKYQVTPNSAEVYVDSIRTRQNPIELSTGSYTLEFRQEGYESNNQEIDLNAGENTDLDITLVEKPKEEIKEDVTPIQDGTDLVTTLETSVICPSDSTMACLRITSNLDNTNVTITDAISLIDIEDILVNSDAIVEVSVPTSFFDLKAAAPNSNKVLEVIAPSAGEILDIEFLLEGKSLFESLSVGVYRDGSSKRPLLLSNTNMTVSVTTPSGKQFRETLTANEYSVIGSHNLESGEYTFDASVNSTQLNAVRNLSSLSELPAVSSLIANNNSSAITISWQGNGENYRVQLYRGNSIVESVETTSTSTSINRNLSEGNYQLCVLAMNWYNETVSQDISATRDCTSFSVQNTSNNINSGSSSDSNNSESNDSGNIDDEPTFTPPDF